MQTKKFRKKVFDYYRTCGRRFPWRKTRDPYRILVSEFMLQQTQTARVLRFYLKFLKRFPTIEKLARAKPRTVLAHWHGLGYNRRALALHRAAKKITGEWKSKVPADYEKLRALPGVGGSTAGAVCAFAYNKPAVFIETNIRAVYIHHFFRTKHSVSDKELLPLIEKTLDRSNPRAWYYALMDYGVYLKERYKNPAWRSKSRTRQSSFKGSEREIRGKIVKILLENKKVTEKGLARSVGDRPSRVLRNVRNLEKEGFIKRRQGKISLV